MTEYEKDIKRYKTILPFQKKIIKEIFMDIQAGDNNISFLDFFVM
jgi:hypothetical protein